jgi:hypothetical protein
MMLMFSGELQLDPSPPLHKALRFAYALERTLAPLWALEGFRKKRLLYVWRCFYTRLYTASYVVSEYHQSPSQTLGNTSDVVLTRSHHGQGDHVFPVSTCPSHPYAAQLGTVSYNMPIISRFSPLKTLVPPLPSSPSKLSMLA